MPEDDKKPFTVSGYIEPDWEELIQRIVNDVPPKPPWYYQIYPEPGCKNPNYVRYEDTLPWWDEELKRQVR